MTEPKKLTPERLDEIREFIKDWAGETYIGEELLSHIAAQEQERDEWKEACEASDLKRYRSGVMEQGLFNRLKEATVERDAAIARAEAAESEIERLRKRAKTLDAPQEVYDALEAERARVKVLEAERDEWCNRCVDAEVHRARAAISAAKEPT